jgi:hypothetical protein
MPYPETIAYIKKQLTEGFTVSEVKKALAESGYQEDIITSLLKKAGVKEKQSEKTTGIEKILMKNIGVGALLLLVVGSLAYVNLYGGEPELFSPDSSLVVDFARSSTLKIPKGGSVELDLNDHVHDLDYGVERLQWYARGDKCLSISIMQGIATITSDYRLDCPVFEEVRFDVQNPKGTVAHDSITIKIK